MAFYRQMGLIVDEETNDIYENKNSALLQTFIDTNRSKKRS